MKTTIIVTSVDHFNMDNGNQGLTVRVVGERENSNNKFGLSISKSPIPDYKELEKLKQYADVLPAKFEADLSFVTKKDNNKNEITTAAFKNLKFLNPVEFTDVVAK